MFFWLCLKENEKFCEKKYLKGKEESEVKAIQLKKPLNPNLKILFLGTGESGTTTFLKQLQHLYSPPLNLNAFKDIIFSNIQESLLKLYKFVETNQSIPPFSEQAFQLSNEAKNYLPILQQQTKFSPLFELTVKCIWRELSIRYAFEHCLAHPDVMW